MKQKNFSRIRVLFGLFLLFIAAPAIAGSSAWTVTQKSGHVEVVRSGMQPASLKVNASLNAGDTVVTGRDGRAMLTRGSDYLLVNANSRLAIPAEESTDGFTRLKQWFGSVFYDVETTGKPHFEVETPLLAAVVKGTKFTITVEADRASVHVTEGVVQVSTADRLVSRDVEAGNIATIYLERSGEIDLAPASDISIKLNRRNVSDLDKEDGRANRNETNVLAPTNAALPLETIEDGDDDVFGLATTGAVESADEIEKATSGTLTEKSVKETVESTAEESTEIVKVVSEEVVSETVDEVVTVVENTVEAVTDVVDSNVEEIVSLVDDTVDAVVDEAVVELVSVVDDTVDAAVGETVEEVAAILEETVEDSIGETVEEVAAIVDDTLEETVSETVEEVASIVDEAVEDSVVETVEKVVEETVEEVVEETVEEAVEEAVEEVEEAVDDVLDGLPL